MRFQLHRAHVVATPLLLGFLVLGKASAFEVVPQPAPPPPGYHLVEGDMYVPEGLEKGTVWEPNTWLGGVVPYVFVVNDATAAGSYTSTTLGFASNPPRILTSAGSDPFIDIGFRADQLVLVRGSASNDNTAATLYRIDWLTNDAIYLDPGDAVVNEGFGASVTLDVTVSVSPNYQAAMVAAMGEWEAVASVDFVPYSTEASYIRISNSVFNRATVGVVGAAGPGTVEIVNWGEKYVMCHELAHALAFKHEQSRADRDDFVTINYQNISTTDCGGSCVGNFEPSTTASIYPASPWGAVYDFDSVMHYGQYYFSIDRGNLTTIDCNPGYESWQDLIGQRTHLSFWDITTMSYAYAPGNWVFLHAQSPTPNPNGTFADPQTSFATAVQSVPSYGKLVILYPDTYAASTSGARLITTPMQIEAPTGGVILQ